MPHPMACPNQVLNPPDPLYLSIYYNIKIYLNLIQIPNFNPLNLNKLERLLLKITIIGHFGLNF